MTFLFILINLKEKKICKHDEYQTCKTITNNITYSCQISQSSPIELLHPFNKFSLYQTSIQITVVVAMEGRGGGTFSDVHQSH
jgi:hypothetical protein